MALRLAAAALALCATQAAALETAQWPPPAAVEARMRELQQVIAGRDSTTAQRVAARAELVGLLKVSPARDQPAPRPSPRGEGALRAAIEPYPSVVKPVDRSSVASPASGVAQLEVVVPPKPMVNPRTGAAAAPSGRFAIDPRTGSVLHETASGYVDPRTGQFVPR